jgi:hypothetical protein
MVALVALAVLAGCLAAPATQWLPSPLASLTARVLVSDARANTYPVYICGTGQWSAMAFGTNNSVQTANAQNCSGGVGGGNGLQVWSAGTTGASGSTGAQRVGVELGDEREWQRRSGVMGRLSQHWLRPDGRRRWEWQRRLSGSRKRGLDRFRDLVSRRVLCPK